MGTLSWSLVEEGSKMKLIAAACLVAAVFAEPEAKADADAALLYGGYGYTGLGYAGPGYAGLGYAGLGYAGLGHHVAAGYSNVSPSGSLNIAGLAPAAIPAVGGAYAGAGRYVANSAGTVHVA